MARSPFPCLLCFFVSVRILLHLFESSFVFFGLKVPSINQLLHIFCEFVLKEPRTGDTVELTCSWFSFVNLHLLELLGLLEIFVYEVVITQVVFGLYFSMQGLVLGHVLLATLDAPHVNK